MNVDLSDEQTAALLGELERIIEGDRYPLSPRIRTLKEIPTFRTPAAGEEAHRGQPIWVEPGTATVTIANAGKTRGGAITLVVGGFSRFVGLSSSGLAKVMADNLRSRSPPTPRQRNSDRASRALTAA
jgi:hypothetical protein